MPMVSNNSASNLKNGITRIFWTAFSYYLLFGYSRPVYASDLNPLNPLNINTIDQLVDLILKAVITIGVPLLVFFFLLTGFYFVTAMGDTAKIKTSWKMLEYTIYGAALVLGAKVIHEILLNTLTILHI